MVQEKTYDNNRCVPSFDIDRLQWCNKNQSNIDRRKMSYLVGKCLMKIIAINKEICLRISYSMNIYDHECLRLIIVFDRASRYELCKELFSKMCPRTIGWFFFHSAETTYELIK